MILHYGCGAKDQVELKHASPVTTKPINSCRPPAHPMLRLQTLIGNQAVRRLVQTKRINDSLFFGTTVLQRHPGGREISRQEIEKCIRKWEKRPEEMSRLAADYFLGEIESGLTARYAIVDCVRDNDCTVTVAKEGPVLDVHWNKETRRIGVGYNHANGRRFCAWEYNGCERFNRRNPDGVLTLTLISCHGPMPPTP